MSVDDPTELIQRALDEFELVHPRVELLESVDHCNARVLTESGTFFVKILANDHTATQLHSRLQFAEFLRDGGLNIPPTIATRTGRPFASVLVGRDVRQAVMSRWIEGETLGDQTDLHWIERCGELLSRLHLRSQTYDPPDEFEVRSWDDVYAPSEDGWLRPFLANSPVDDAAKEVIESAAARTRSIDERLLRDRQTYGLIHADFHGDNLIFDGEAIWIVDLEDVGWGHFPFDLAWPVVLFAKNHPDVAKFSKPFLRGYERMRPLSLGEKELLPEFLLAAGLGALEMIDSSSIANDSPKAQEWLRSIVEWLRSHLATIDGRPNC
jgi:Ser/Thr protein kinase RdoA (MazF antagonist)